jgi:N-terminal domain of (some) glycogen debranching enzymes
MANDTISIVDGSTFVVNDARGDIDAGPDQPHGLFHRDTRFLSRGASPWTAGRRTRSRSFDPVLPSAIGHIALRRIPGRWGREDVVATGASVPA